jgi:phage portal protein BeeE
MDTATLMKTLGDGVKGGLLKPDEGRRRLNLSPVDGGDAVYLQQQNYSLAALAKRDAQADPFGTAAPPAPPALPAPEPAEPAEPDAEVRSLADALIAKFMTAEAVG